MQKVRPHNEKVPFKLDGVEEKGVSSTDHTNISPKSANTVKFELKESLGDLINADPKFSIATQTSLDLATTSPLATRLESKFKCRDELKNQNLKVGDCGYVKRDDRYIFYLITKERHYDKALYNDLQTALTKCRSFVIK